MKPIMKRQLRFALVFMLILSGSLVLVGRVRSLEKIKYPELKPFNLPQIDRSTTANGIKLRLIKNDTLPLIELKILFKGGEAYEPRNRIGLATATARLLRIGGTSELDPEKLDRFLDTRAISLSIDADSDYFSISLSCLEEDFADAVSLLAAILRKPAFAGEKLSEIKLQLQTAIARRNDDPAGIVSREFERLIYGPNSPLAAPIEYDHVIDLSRQDIQEFHRAFFAPDNMLVGVIGPLDMPRVKEIFEKLFGDWHHSAQIPPYPQVEEPERDFKVALAEKSNLNQTYLAIGQFGLKEESADYTEKARIMVFNSIFSGGFSSRLMSRVRVKMGLTYGIGGGIITNPFYAGKTVYSTFTQSKNTLKAIAAIIDEIEGIRKQAVSAGELQGAKDYFLNSYVFRFSTPEQILESSLRNEFYGIPGDFLENLVKAIKGVSAADILATANKYLQPEKMVIMIVGKEADIQGDLAQFGKVKKLDISIKPPTPREN